MTRICLLCNKVFEKSDWDVLHHNRGKYCSKPCANKAALGRRNSPNTEFKKGIVPKGSIIFKKGENMESDNQQWKGDKVGYSGLHRWIYKRLGKPSLCDHCGTDSAKKFEWANKSGLYTRELTDWLRLCTKCHHKYDGIHDRQRINL